MRDEGWKRRSIAVEPRLSEIVEMYEQLGFEVRLEPFDPEDPAVADEECTVCLEDPSMAGDVRVVFTRPRQDVRRDDDDELFG
jgi:hypothetical protein